MSKNFNRPSPTPDLWRYVPAEGVAEWVQAEILAEDGRIHKPVGHKLPWGAGPGAFHWRCRSGRTFVLKSLAELGIDAPEIVVVGRERASMDGAVPAETTYGEWLKRQSLSRQVDVLGETRARLMRDGGMSMGEMYTTSGKTLTLDELRQRDADAFKRAGL